MAILTFTLGPEALGKLHDALICLGKFSDAVAFDASHDKLVLNAMNSSKSAYASFTLMGNKFFSRYMYKPPKTGPGHPAKEKYICKMYNKALLSVFKGRIVDPTRERETSVERCDVSIEDGDEKAKSRFVIKIICRHGVLKTYRLTFEEVTPMHARFVRESAMNTWTISSKTLREFVEHFGPGTEQLDIYSEDGRVSFTSFTEKIASGNEILKQPLHTTIAIDTLEFGEFSVEEKLHIIISVKDFKAIISHAGVTNTNVKARYSHPSSPMQLSYQDEGIIVEFILMTIGDYRGASATPSVNNSRATSKRPASRQPLEATASSKRANTSNMPPPSVVSRSPNISREILIRKDSRPSPPPPQPSVHSQALFYAEEDEDKRWDPQNYDDDQDEMLLWDKDGFDAPITVNSGSHPPRSGNFAESAVGYRNQTNTGAVEDPESLTVPTQRISPTQRVSEIKGIFD